MTPDDFAAATGVSRETLERLKAYDAVLMDWASRMNLVAKSTLEDRWRRHFLDSAQLYPLVPSAAKTLLDLGSGAGFPGLVLAAMGADRGLSVRLVDSTQKKCAFLRAAAEAMAVEVEVSAVRVEAIKGVKADVVTARAFASLAKTLAYAEPLIDPAGVLLAPKGANAKAELTEAANGWNMTYDLHNSVTDPAAVIVEVKDFARAP
ncbi:MAG: 16S rRNA (guanine(527)-N(7))-methyltransferase RsmG [Pseudomonadota bacterium]